jgi:elongation factor Ts
MSATMITAKDVAALRARTGAGRGDCKKALEESGGDQEKAIDILRTKGMMKAEKRADRAASEGQIVTWVSDDRTLGVMIELNSETDFVARNDEFVALAKLVAAHIGTDTTLDGVAEIGADHAVLNKQWSHDKSLTLAQVVKAAAAKTGENVTLRRVARLTTTGTIGSYLHHNAKVGVLAEVTGATGPAAVALGNSVAEHVAAGVPTIAVAVRKEDVSPDLVAREKAIFVAQAKEAGSRTPSSRKWSRGGWTSTSRRSHSSSSRGFVTTRSRLASSCRRLRAPLSAEFIRFQMGEA